MGRSGQDVAAAALALDAADLVSVRKVGQESGLLPLTSCHGRDVPFP